MIRYDLKCDAGHGFDSWFQSARAFDALSAAGQLDCPVCGSARIDKALMAPRVGAQSAAPAPAPHPPGDPRRAALAALKARVEASSDYVGRRFADEARAIHDGAAPARAIHGEAGPREARRLVEDGIPILPLPFVPKARTN